MGIAFERLVEECVLTIARGMLGEETGLYAQRTTIIDVEASGLVLNSVCAVTDADEAPECHILISEFSEVNTMN